MRTGISLNLQKGVEEKRKIFPVSENIRNRGFLRSCATNLRPNPAGKARGASFPSA